MTRESKNIPDIEPTGRAYNLRPSREKYYGDMQFLHDAVIDTNDGGFKEPVFKHLTCIIMTHISVKAEKRKHGKLTIDALFVNKSN